MQSCNNSNLSLHIFVHKKLLSPHEDYNNSKSFLSLQTMLFQIGWRRLMSEQKQQNFNILKIKTQPRFWQRNTMQQHPRGFDYREKGCRFRKIAKHHQQLSLNFSTDLESGILNSRVKYKAWECSCNVLEVLKGHIFQKGRMSQN